MKKLILFINGNLGKRILKHLSECDETKIVAIVLNGKNKIDEAYSGEVQEYLQSIDFEGNSYQYSKDLWSEPKFLKDLKDSDYGVSALFGHLFPSRILEAFDGKLINLHPSLLPIGRGSDPVFWSIIEGNPQGATIHIVDEHLDTGGILVQEEIPINTWLTSGQIYDLVNEKLFQLFIEFYPSWSQDSPVLPQIGKTTEHHSSQLKKIRSDLLNKNNDIFNTLNLVQALTYSDNRKMQLRLPNEEIWEVTLQTRKVL